MLISGLIFFVLCNDLLWVFIRFHCRKIHRKNVDLLKVDYIVFNPHSFHPTVMGFIRFRYQKIHRKNVDPQKLLPIVFIIIFIYIHII